MNKKTRNLMETASASFEIDTHDLQDSFIKTKDKRENMLKSSCDKFIHR